MTNQERRCYILGMYAVCMRDNSIDSHAKEFIEHIQKLPGIKDNFHALKAFGHLRKKNLEKYKTFTINKANDQLRKEGNARMRYQPAPDPALNNFMVETTTTGSNDW